MESLWIAFVTMTVIFTAGNCQPTSNKIDIPVTCKNRKLCDEKPEIYDTFQGRMDESMKIIYEFWDDNSNTTDFDILPPRDAGLPGNCQAETRWLKPFIHISNTTTLVVQTKFFEQKFLITSCKQRRTSNNIHDAKCFDPMGLAFSGYEGTCTSKQTTVKVYVYNTYRKVIERIPVQIDVCCVCDITSTDGVEYLYD